MNRIQMRIAWSLFKPNVLEMIYFLLIRAREKKSPWLTIFSGTSARCIVIIMQKSVGRRKKTPFIVYNSFSKLNVYRERFDQFYLEFFCVASFRVIIYCSDSTRKSLQRAKHLYYQLYTVKLGAIACSCLHLQHYQNEMQTLLQQN